MWGQHSELFRVIAMTYHMLDHFLNLHAFEYHQHILVRTFNFATANGGKSGINVSIYWLFTRPYVLDTVENILLYLNEYNSLVFRSTAFSFFSFRFFLHFFVVIFNTNKFFLFIFCESLCYSLETFLKNENIVFYGTSF